MNEIFKNAKSLFEKAIVDIQERLRAFEQQTQPPSTSNIQPSLPSASYLTNTGFTDPNDNLDYEGEDSSSNDGSKKNENLNDENSFASMGALSQTEDGEPNLLNILYEALMDCIAAAKFACCGASNGFITASLENLNSLWIEFRTAYRQAITTKVPIDFSYSVVQMKYMKTTGELNDLEYSDNKHKVKSADVQFSLPKLKLHEFNGKVSEWKSFIANFDRKIHNNATIDDSMKIEYLKITIRGDAAKLINHIDPSPENYQICYDILKKRFENKREILNCSFGNIINLPKLKSESAEQLKALHDGAYENIMSIQSIGVSIHNWDSLLTFIISSKLDPQTIVHYECQLADVREPQSLKDLLAYIESRFMALQLAAYKSDTFGNEMNEKSQNDKERDKKQFKCIFCSESHSVRQCQIFKKKSTNERFNWVKAENRCINCMGLHKVSECKSKYSCETCKKKHNTLLHLEKKENEKYIKPNVAKKTEETETVHVNSNVAQKSGSVLLATILLGAFDKNGARILLRALLDQGSHSAFLSETAVQTLKLQRKSINATITGIGEKEQQAKHIVTLTIFSSLRVRIYFKL